MRYWLSLFGLVASQLSASADFTSARIVADGIDRPVFVTQAPGESNSLIVVQQNTAQGTGRVIEVDLATGLKTNFLEVTSPVPYFEFSEGGVHGLAFSPDYQTNHLFYLSRMWFDGTRFTNRLEEYVVGANGAQFNRLLIQTDNPTTVRGHGINWIGFDPTATGAARNQLYITWGDGGIQADEPGFINRSQDLSVPFGKVLRIDVSGPDAYPNDPEKNYAIPDSNPFANDGNPNTMGEVLHSGLRNPWRASFDPATGDMYLTDSGHSRWEELNIIKAGQVGLDFGWSNREGTEQTNYPPNATGGPLGSSQDPFFQYGRSSGVATVGVELYDGPMQSLDGRLIFSDYFGRIYSAKFDNSIAAAQFNGANATDLIELTQEVTAQLGRPIGLLSSMGHDNAGNIYFASAGPTGNTNGTGFVFTITAVPEPMSLGIGGLALVIAGSLSRRRKK